VSLSLTMTKENGGTLNVQLLRPLEWFLTEIVVLLGTSEDPQSLYQSPVHVTAAKDTTDYKLQQLLLGQRIYLDLPELGAQGLAVRSKGQRDTVDRSQNRAVVVRMTERS